MYMSIYAVCILAVISFAFEIPLPFGSISFGKNENGETQFGINNSVNILGYGGNSGLQINSKNGSITTESKYITNLANRKVLINGTEYGTNSTFGVDQSKGLNLNTDLKLGENKTIEGGLGKEGSFIQGLINQISTMTNQKKNVKQK